MRPWCPSGVSPPMTGYFGWVEKRGDKNPHYAHGSGVLSVAATAATRKVANGSETARVIIAALSRGASEQMHDRLPVFLTEKDLGEWLDPGRLDSVQARGLATHIGDTRDTIAHEPKVNQLRVTPRE